MANGPNPFAPVRVGIDRRTGLMLVGWDHTAQSLETLFVTGYHERILEQWVGSFVPHMLGESATPRVITRFFWAISSAIDLWEPNYSVKRVRIMNRDGSDPGKTPVERLTSVAEIRRGEVSFQVSGEHRPRGHLGDFTPEGTRALTLLGLGNNTWKRLVA